MRLLNCSTGKLVEFFGSIAPRYTILSHTWGKDEVIFQEMASVASTAFTDGEEVGATGGARFDKIFRCCEQSLKLGIDYTWIDTGTIDKSSSSELPEAINSMFRWYKDAEVRFAYLADVNQTQSDITFEESFAKSRWFTRGWTLQELIAPQQLFFFNANWASVGTKATLQHLISETTGIGKRTLLETDLFSISIAKRMSWASRRQTTRLEDLAYCLIGIFDVYIPLLGE